MTTDSRQLGPSSPAIRTALLFVMIIGIMADAATADGNDPLPRVRSENQVIAGAIREATERSQTFRRLVKTIDSTNGLVYVEDGKCLHSVRACLLVSVQVAGPYRLLRILVDMRKIAGTELMGSLGHELQHAIEVLRNPKITDSHAMFQFYHREVGNESGRFETQEAIKVGLDVLNELYAHAERR
jgi:hypothetical protein